MFVFALLLMSASLLHIFFSPIYIHWFHRLSPSAGRLRPDPFLPVPTAVFIYQSVFF